LKALRSAAMGALVAATAAFGSNCSSASEQVDELWGFADLHAHPAFHLAYGAGLTGDPPGIMWGTPGMALEDDTVASDLKPCDAATHGRSNIIANVLLTQLAQVLGSPHGENGYPSFENWPLATAGLHQQMHVTWLRRAWEGGQRLLVASAVENATLAAAFSGHLSLDAGTIHDNERATVEAQIQFVRKFVDANSTWLAIATSSDEARAAILGNKMAIVLGTETDTLDEQQMRELFAEGVRVFIPIHLADNDLGGTAVYEPMFDIHNAYVRGVGYAIQHDPNLEFALDLNISPNKLLGLPLPDPNNNENDGIEPGHRNKKGLSDTGKATIHAMIALGAIIDVAHMSEASIDDTLTIAEGAQVPLIDSHTGVRPVSEHAYSERDLRFDAARRIGKLGGMIGLGTGGITAQRNPTPARTFYSAPFAKLLPTASWYADKVPQPAPPTECKGLSIEVATADDDIREGSFGRVDVTVHPDPDQPGETRTHELNRGFHVDNGQSIRRLIPLPERTLASQVDVLLRHDTHNACLQTDDKWNVGSIELSCGPRAFDSDGRKTLEGDDRFTVAVSTADTSPTSSVLVDVWTGDEHLDGSNQLDVDVHTTGGVTTGCQDVLHQGSLDSKTLQRIQCSLPSPVAMNEIDSVTLHKHGSSDKWDVEAATVGLDDAEQAARFVDQAYSPALELTDAPLLLASATLPQRMVRLTIRSGSGGLEKGIDATATFHFDSGPDQTFRLNKGAALSAGQIDAGLTIELPLESNYQFFVVLDGGRLSSDIQSVRIDAPGLRSEWPITQVVLEAFEEPVERWVADLEATTDALSRTDGCFLEGLSCGVALGTDLNGMAPGIPGTTISPYDPTRPGEYVLDYPFELGKQPIVAGRLETGTKTWDVMSDGIAHVGLLPDFLVAAAHAKRDHAASTVATIFHSAGDFVRMWTKIEAHRQ
jgi:microsomal dipeptidase-like Zn-dependent dipeptidase